MTNPSRQQAYQLGHEAEARCAAWLAAQAYQIIAIRQRTPYGEIDVIARYHQTLIFVEVKARGTHESGLYAISKRQQARIMRSAVYYVSQNPCYSELDLRFDVMVLAKDDEPLHVPNAFDATDRDW